MTGGRLPTGNTGLQYRVVQTLAAASRVLASKKRALGEECLAAARKIWDYEQTNTPVYAPSAYVPRGSKLSGRRDRSYSRAMAHHSTMRSMRSVLPLCCLRSAPLRPTSLGTAQAGCWFE